MLWRNEDDWGDIYNEREEGESTDLLRWNGQDCHFVSALLPASTIFFLCLCLEFPAMNRHRKTATCHLRRSPSRQKRKVRENNGNLGVEQVNNDILVQTQLSIVLVKQNKQFRLAMSQTEVH